MKSSNSPVLYLDSDLQNKHEDLFRNSVLKPLASVLPPKIDEITFKEALNRLASVVGKDNVHTGASLVNYIDPFEQWEEERRNTPSAAVW
jgi:hypothetical protein